MQITFDTNNLSGLDIAVLSSLVGSTQGRSSLPAPDVTQPKVLKQAEKPVNRQPEPEPEPEPKADGDDALLASEATMEDAVAVAKDLVSSGEAAKVKSVLKGLGVERVSQLKPDQLGAFVTALS